MYMNPVIAVVSQAPTKAEIKNHVEESTKRKKKKSHHSLRPKESRPIFWKRIYVFKPGQGRVKSKAAV